ncbi:MAG: hypothetical protein FJ304_00135 [Planctomycetes bacterium]|nr:hypothetical protein [Planctomycetota bacterium]
MPDTLSAAVAAFIPAVDAFNREFYDGVVSWVYSPPKPAKGTTAERKEELRAEIARTGGALCRQLIQRNRAGSLTIELQQFLNSLAADDRSPLHSDWPRLKAALQVTAAQSVEPAASPVAALVELPTRQQQSDHARAPVPAPDAEPRPPTDERALLTWLRWAQAELKRMLLHNPPVTDPLLAAFGDKPATDIARRAYRFCVAQGVDTSDIKEPISLPGHHEETTTAFKIVEQCVKACERSNAPLAPSPETEPADATARKELAAVENAHQRPDFVLPDPLPDDANPFEVISWILFTGYVAARHLTEARQKKVAEMGRKMRTDVRNGVEYLHWEDEPDCKHEVSRSFTERAASRWSKALCDARNLCAAFGIPFAEYDPVLKTARELMNDRECIIEGVASDREAYWTTSIDTRLHELRHSTTPPTSARPTGRREGEPSGPNAEAVALLKQYLVERFRDGHLYAPYILLRKELMDAGCTDGTKATELTDKAMNELYLRGFVTPDPNRRSKWPIDWQILPTVVSANGSAPHALPTRARQIVPPHDNGDKPTDSQPDKGTQSLTDATPGARQSGEGESSENSKAKGVPRDEAEVRVREWLEKHAADDPDAVTRDTVSAETGVSAGGVSNTSAWKAFCARRTANKKPVARDVPLTETMKAIIPADCETPDELAALIEEQKADEAEQERRYKRRHGSS